MNFVKDLFYQTRKNLLSIEFQYVIFFILHKHKLEVKKLISFPDHVIQLL